MDPNEALAEIGEQVTKTQDTTQLDALLEAGARLAEVVQGERVLLVHGDPAEGFTFVGPVTPNDPDLDRFIDTELRNVTWWYLPLRTLAEGAPQPGTDPADLDDGRPCELTYTVVVNVHPEDGEPDGGLPADVPIEFYKLPDDVADTLAFLGNDYLSDVNEVKPSSIRFLA